MNTRSVSRSLGLSILVMGTLAVFTAGCTGLFSGKMFKERAAETPVPVEENFDKTFFVNANGKPKTFMCAYAPEMTKGWIGEEVLMPLVNGSPHCNIEFEITENFVIAKMVQPSYLNDKSRWLELLKIPIKKHFYYEREKDAHGRETNRYIENDQRSHWSARPKMRLDLGGIESLDVGARGIGSFLASSVSDREIDIKNGFLAFSIDGVFKNPFWGADYQAKFRINFMEYKHDDTFKSTPYNEENSRLINVLHVVGHKVEGQVDAQELFAAHWEFCKDPKRIETCKTKNLYLNGVPAEIQDTIVAAVYRWNKTLVQTGVVPKGHLAFTPVVKNLKHPFDLRYPSINWISDKSISSKACLGIGMASADLQNGQILWGSVTLFGGVLENYINSYTPAESGGASGYAGMTGGSDDLASPFAAMAGKLPHAMLPMPNLDKLTSTPQQQLMNKLVLTQTTFLEGEIKRLSRATDEASRRELKALQDQMQTFQVENPRMGEIALDMQKVAAAEFRNASFAFSEGKTLQGMMGATFSDQPKLSAQKSLQAQGNEQLAALIAETSGARRAEMARNLRPQSSAFVMETDLTAENMAGSWAKSPAHKTRTYPEMLKSVVMHLAIHELGHFLGLGHQFKENIVPEAGTVPSRYVKELEAQATEEQEFSNATSVMGYRSGRVEMITDVKDITPGPHDELVLRYIYKGEYSTYDKTADEFVFAPIPSNGKIPEYSTVRRADGSQAKLPTSYFPACNDWQASLGADPYCDRWDRGSKAQDIVRSHFEHISDNLLDNLYSLAGGGGNALRAEARLWRNALYTFSRVRMFYDEMRRELRSEPHLKPLWNQLRTDKNALFEFSTACQEKEPTGPKVNSPILREIFADRKIVDLCRASQTALDEMGFFLNLPQADYPKIDHKNTFVGGGYLVGDVEENSSHAFGSWYQMSNFPLKYTSLFTLTNANPFILYGPYVWPNPYYDSEENRYLYRTLYPQKYTKLIADTVIHNMRFAVEGGNETTNMGRAILATGGLLPWQRYESNDAGRLTREYTDMLNQQSEFDYSVVAILITATPPDSGSKIEAEHFQKFTAKIYDYFTDKTITASDVYILPRGDVLVKANGMFLYPRTKLKFINDTEAYVIAYKISYDYEEGDKLVESSVKASLMAKHTDIIRTCIDGFQGHGLVNYFTSANENFKGFNIPSGIASEGTRGEKIGQFYKTVETAFSEYEKYAASTIPPQFPRSMAAICDQAILGVGQISASAALMNGYWLSFAPDLVEK